MNVVAMLAWWDEPPEELDACVRSLPVLCDSLVAVDGAYEMTPGKTVSSPPEQAEAIIAAAEAVGLEARVIVPDRIWIGQVEKRDFMLREAATDADWLLAVDADHRLVGDRDKVRAELRALRDGVESIRHTFYTPPPKRMDDLKAMSPHQWHTNLAGRSIEHSLLIRRVDDMRMERDHWGYSGVVNGKRVALGNWRSKKYPACRYHRLHAPFRIEHVCFQRDQMRLDRNKRYCQLRDKFKGLNGYEP